MNRKEINTYNKHLEKIRESVEEDEQFFQRLKSNNPNYKKPYNAQLKISGFHVELSVFEKPVWRGTQRNQQAIEEGVEKRKESMAIKKELDKELADYANRYPNATKEDEEALAALKAIKSKYEPLIKTREDNYRRKVNKLKSKIQANFDSWTHFITLSFKENEMDVPRAKKRFEKWVEKMKKIYPDFLYVYVIEWQQRGAVHFHVVSSLDVGKKVHPKKFKETCETWTYGSIDIVGVNYKYVSKEHQKSAEKELMELSQSEKLKTIWSIGNYLVSYLKKDADSVLLFGSKLYGASSDLKEEIVIRDEKKIAQVIKGLGLGNLKRKDYEINIEQTDNKVMKSFFNMLIKK